MKKLYLIRHGEAAFGAASDFERELTHFGRQQVDLTANALLTHVGKENSLNTVIWASPLVRAQQTAQIIASILGCPVETKDFLTPDDNPTDALIKIHEQANTERLILVTHMPFVADFACKLTDDRSFRIGFNTAECQLFKCSDYLPGCGKFISQIPATF